MLDFFSSNLWRWVSPSWSGTWWSARSMCMTTSCTSITCMRSTGSMWSQPCRQIRKQRQNWHSRCLLVFVFLCFFSFDFVLDFLLLLISECFCSQNCESLYLLVLTICVCFFHCDPAPVCNLQNEDIFSGHIFHYITGLCGILNHDLHASIKELSPIFRIALTCWLDLRFFFFLHIAISFYINADNTCC